MKPKNGIGQSFDTLSDKIFMVFVYAILSIVAVLMLAPLLNVVAASFSDPNAIKLGKVTFFPVDFTLLGYESVFRSQQLLTGFRNSFLYMTVGTLVNLFMTMIAAFPLSRKEFYGRNVVMTIFLITMYFSGGLVPTFMVVNSLGLLDSMWAVILPGAMSVWFVIIARTFLQTNIPNEIYQAALVDGCDNIYFFIRIVLPLSGPILAVLGLYYAVGHWNSYFSALIYLKSSVKFPLQLILRNILVQNEIDASMMLDLEKTKHMQGLADLLRYSVIVVSSIPVMLLYPFAQKYFVKGVMIGALKG